MASDSLQQLYRDYADEHYATRNELRRGLGTSLIDYPWKALLSYRASYAVDASFASLSGKSLRLCLVPGVERKMKEAGALLAALEDRSAALLAHEKEFLSACAPAWPGLPPSAYAAALRALPSCADEGALLTLEGALLGAQPASPYRQSDSKSKYTFLLDDARFAECPHALLPQYMAQYYAFCAGSLPPLAKALCSLYLFLYLKPLSSGNEACACLFAKGILAQEYPRIAPYLPLEALAQRNEEFEAMDDAIQLEGDLTYALSLFLEKLLLSLTAMSEKADSFGASSPQKETLKPEEPKAEPRPSPASTASKEGDAAKADSAAKETPAPVAPAPQEEAPMPSAGLAISLPKPDLDAKQVKELASYLLVSNPRLKRAQALFYASHCRLGGYYSIQDYKKFAGCVYETARTSMETLAREGYYKKVQIKNKFLYTPIPQGE